MNKALEMVRTMINGANEYEKKTGDKNPPVYFSKDNLLIIEEALHRLESIDNANPSEALELVDKMANYILLDEEYGFIDEKEKQAIIKDRDTIKNYILKAQEPKQFKDSKEFKIEIPESSLMDYNPVKHYLKWEDLEFKAENSKQNMAVLLNGTKYTLVVGCNVHFDKLAILRNGGINYYFLEADKQFFNDLHLERVEE